jgi:protein-S-isoprenylcysteine O-methyltransferase Ste14
LYLGSALLATCLMPFLILFITLSIPDLLVYGGKVHGPPLVPCIGTLFVAAGVVVRIAQFRLHPKTVSDSK